MLRGGDSASLDPTDGAVYRVDTTSLPVAVTASLAVTSSLAVIAVVAGWCSSREGRTASSIPCRPTGLECPRPLRREGLAASC